MDLEDRGYSLQPHLVSPPAAAAAASAAAATPAQPVSPDAYVGMRLAGNSSSSESLHLSRDATPTTPPPPPSSSNQASQDHRFTFAPTEFRHPADELLTDIALGDAGLEAAPHPDVDNFVGDDLDGGVGVDGLLNPSVVADIAADIRDIKRSIALQKRPLPPVRPSAAAAAAREAEAVAAPQPDTDEDDYDDDGVWIRQASQSSVQHHQHQMQHQQHNHQMMTQQQQQLHNRPDLREHSHPFYGNSSSSRLGGDASLSIPEAAAAVQSAAPVLSPSVNGHQRQQHQQLHFEQQQQQHQQQQQRRDSSQQTHAGLEDREHDSAAASASGLESQVWRFPRASSSDDSDCDEVDDDRDNDDHDQGQGRLEGGRRYLKSLLTGQGSRRRGCYQRVPQQSSDQTPNSATAAAAAGAKYSAIRTKSAIATTTSRTVAATAAAAADYDSDIDTDGLMTKQYASTERRVEFPELSADDKRCLDESRKDRGREVAVRHPDQPTVLIEGLLFRALYLGSTQLVTEGQPNKSTRMAQAQEAVGRIKAPDGENQPCVPVDLFISTEKIMVLNTNLQEIMMDHALKTISYIADIGNILVFMARRRFLQQSERRQTKIVCHVFETDEAQLVAQSIGHAFQVAYMEFLRANGIEDPGYQLRDMDYQDVLNQQDIIGEELSLFSRRDTQKEVMVPKAKGEPLGVVIVESGWGSMLPTVVLANMQPSGPAARCGQLNIGDQLLAINGTSLVGLPLATCQQHVKSCKSFTAVKVSLVSCPPVVEVLIRRPDVKFQLGFSVQNGVICSLLRGGIAERGGVRVGHRIIEINGQSVVATPHDRIVAMLASGVGEIHMKTMPTSIFRLLTGQEVPHYI